MRYMVCAMCLFVFSSCAIFNPNNNDTLSNDPNLEYRCAGKSPECLNASESISGNCLRTGGVWINEAVNVSVKKIEKLGAVFLSKEKYSDQAGSVTYKMPAKVKDEKPVLFTIYHKYGKTSGVQFTGEKTSMDLSFSSIKLGDSKDTVAAVLCSPRKIEKGKDEGNYVWDYYPYPASVEFVKGKVYSIKIGDCNRM